MTNDQKYTAGIDPILSTCSMVGNLIGNDNIYIDMQAGRNLLPKLPVADN